MVDYAPIKIVLLGSPNVGKSSILERLVDKTFSKNQRATVGSQVAIKWHTHDGSDVQLEIWDTAGLEKTEALPLQNYCRRAKGVILVYDITDYSSFKKVQELLEVIKDSFEDPERPIVLILGNKIDVDNRNVRRKAGEEFSREKHNLFLETSANSREVTRAAGDEFSRKENTLFLETSAMCNIGVEQAFDELVRKIIENPNLMKTRDTLCLIPSADPTQDDSFIVNSVECLQQRC